MTRIGIIGAGAIGGVVGGLLTRAGYDVTLFDHWVEHIDAMKQNGLRLSGPLIGDIRVPVNAKHLYEAQEISRTLRSRLRRRQELRHRVGLGLHLAAGQR